MAARCRYKTRHHESILALLTENPEGCFSVDDICAALAERGRPIDRTTAYRQLEKMAEDGAALKYISEKGESATYRLGEEGAPPHLHLKCLDCGGLKHIDCSAAEGFSRHLMEQHSFNLDPSKTVIYGHCGCVSERGGKA